MFLFLSPRFRFPLLPSPPAVLHSQHAEDSTTLIPDSGFTRGNPQLRLSLFPSFSSLPPLPAISLSLYPISLLACSECHHHRHLISFPEPPSSVLQNYFPDERERGTPPIGSIRDSFFVSICIRLFTHALFTRNEARFLRSFGKRQFVSWHGIFVGKNFPKRRRQQPRSGEIAEIILARACEQNNGGGRVAR